MRIVGLNSGLDSLMKPISGGSVACVCDGKIEFAMAEDRASRKKYDGGYAHSLRMMYDYLEIGVKDVDFFVISFYGHPLIPRKDILAHHLKDLGLEKIPEKLVVIPSHHLSHAYAAYFLSPFEESLIMIADNEGSLLFSKDAEQKGTHSNYCERNRYYWARGNEIVLIGRDFETPGNAGFGKVYNKFTRYIGFGNYHNAGKTMGLSSYGRFPESWRSVDLWAMDAEGSLQSTLRDTWSTVPDMENFLKNNKIEFSLSQAPDRYLEQAGKDLAQYVQGQLNKWSLRKVGHLLEKTGVKNVCIAGGVGLNGVMNTYIEQKTGQSVFVPPFPSDQGQALGNAIWGSHYLEGVAHLRCLTFLKNIDHFKQTGFCNSLPCVPAAKRIVINCEQCMKFLISLRILYHNWRTKAA